MASNLYEILGVGKDAAPEEVRKAYRKRALQTHPDRLPQGATEADKSAAEEHFRLVNNAYEVLNNPENRKLYDQHGVWPPPADQPQPQTSGDQFDPFMNMHAQFNNAFFPFSNSRPQFMFTDPFELFNSLFGDLHAAFENDPAFANTPFFRSPFDDPFFRSDPFGSSPFGRAGDPFGSSPFGRANDPFGFGGSPFGRSPFAGMLGGSMFPAIQGMPSNSNTRMYSSSTQSIGQNGQWVSRSQMTRSVNGRTEVITKRVDVNGDEHVTYSSPDGERYTINGVEQPAGRPLEGVRRSDSDRASRHPPQAIADRPANPPVNYASPPPQAQGYSVPIAGSSHSHRHPEPPTQMFQPVIPPLPQHERRSSRHSHRERERTSYEGPHRSYTTPVAAATSPPMHGPDRRYSSHVSDPRPLAGDYRTHRETASRSEPLTRRERREHRGPPVVPSKHASMHADTPLGDEVKEGVHHQRRGWRGWLNSVFHPFRNHNRPQHKEM